MTIKQLLKEDTDKTSIQFLRYCFVGGLAFIVDYGIMVLLVEIFALHAVLASAIAFILGLIVNYLLSTFWIFKKSRLHSRVAEFVGFAVIGLIGLGINAAIIWFFQDYLAAWNVIPILYYRGTNIMRWAKLFRPALYSFGIFLRASWCYSNKLDYRES